MFCSDCGAKADGRFCWQCGAKLHGRQTTDPGRATAESSDESHAVKFAPGSAIDSSERAGVDWSDEICYERLLAVDAVRDRVVAAGRRHQPGVSGEQFLAVFDAIVPTGVSIEKLSLALQPVYGRLGIKTGQTASWLLPARAGEAFVAVLCALASHGHTLKSVEQATTRCDLKMAIPSSLWALAGELVVTLERESSGTRVIAAANVTGQMFDWGHCRRVLDRIHAGIVQELAEICGGTAAHSTKRAA